MKGGPQGPIPKGQARSFALPLFVATSAVVLLGVVVSGCDPDSDASVVGAAPGDPDSPGGPIMAVADAVVVAEDAADGTSSTSTDTEPWEMTCL